MSENINKNNRNRTLSIALCGLFVALLAICSWISIPLTVPVTMQTFAVFLCAGLLGTKRSVASIGCWILMGFIGVPVFAGFQGGPAVIIGPLGGYIVGFIVTAIIVGVASDKISRKPVVLGVAMFIGLVICYAIGTVWFMYFYTKASGPIGLGATLGMCVFPFVIPDCVKIVIAVILTKRLERFV
ncbi:MAG: biotin transporter BioY [Eubacterium sp.]|nr:biotin transporter BioY [Candidatus Colimonas fimequi]